MKYYVKHGIIELQIFTIVSSTYMNPNLILLYDAIRKL